MTDHAGTVEGFTFAFSAGIAMQGNGNVVSGNIFEGNAGRGVGVEFGNATIQRNIFRNTICDVTRFQGVILLGTIFLYRASAQIVNNVIENNSSCPAINLVPNTTATAINNTIVGNQVGILIDNPFGEAHLYQNNAIVQNA